MNISRLSAWSIRPYWTSRSATSGTPYRVTRSYAITAARFLDQCGSEYVRLTRCAPTCSAHSGLIAAFCRAQRRPVSTSSPAIRYVGLAPLRELPGKIANRLLRAPRYSRGPRSLRSRSSSRPMWLSSPASRAWWMPSESTPSAGLPIWMPISLHTWRSWDSKSCHSRTRR